MRAANTTWTRGQVLSFMATLALAARDPMRAESYVLELLSWLAYNARST